MSFLVATNAVASQPPERRPTGTPHARANKLKYMNCNAKSLCITSMMLMTVSKNPALSQKVLEDWLRLPERQELFAGLLYGATTYSSDLHSCLF